MSFFTEAVICLILTVPCTVLAIVGFSEVFKKKLASGKALLISALTSSFWIGATEQRDWISVIFYCVAISVIVGFVYTVAFAKKRITNPLLFADEMNENRLEGSSAQLETERPKSNKSTLKKITVVLALIVPMIVFMSGSANSREWYNYDQSGKGFKSISAEEFEDKYNKALMKIEKRAEKIKSPKKSTKDGNTIEYYHIDEKTDIMVLTRGGKVYAAGYYTYQEDKFDENAFREASYSPYKKALVATFLDGEYTEKAEEIIGSFKADSASKKEYVRNYSDYIISDSYSKDDLNMWIYIFGIGDGMDGMVE